MIVFGFASKLVYSSSTKRRLEVVYRRVALFLAFRISMTSRNCPSDARTSAKGQLCGSHRACGLPSWSQRRSMVCAFG